MKIAKEWLKSWDRANAETIDVEEYLRILRRIQLNAYKAGMTEAADIVAIKSVRENPHNILMMNRYVEDVLSARDKKETL